MAAKEEGNTRLKSRRSRVLWEITLLVVVVYLIGGLAAFLISINSYNDLAEKSTDSSSYSYLALSEMERLLDTYGIENIDFIEFYQKMQLQDINDLYPLQEFLVTKFQKMKEMALLGLDYIFMFIPDPISGEEVEFASNRRDKIYMEFPQLITDAMEAGESWLLLENGFPELELEGAQLVTFSRIPSPVQEGVDLVFMGVTPMGESIAEINQYYDDEKRDTMVSFILVTLISITVIMFATFFILRLLIRKRITEPIDILSAEAGDVMKGNLDIDVQVHEGGEFEELETAFKEMVDSIRAYIEKSIGGGPEEG